MAYKYELRNGSSVQSGVNQQLTVKFTTSKCIERKVYSMSTFLEIFDWQDNKWPIFCDIINYIFDLLNNIASGLYGWHVYRKGSFLTMPNVKSISIKSVQLPYGGSIRHWQKMTSGVGVG